MRKSMPSGKKVKSKPKADILKFYHDVLKSEDRND